jgi:hypothetical protein
MVSQSDWLPMMIATGFEAAGFFLAGFAAIGIDFTPEKKRRIIGSGLRRARKAAFFFDVKQ